MSKTASELRNELKELRKNHPDFKPVSKMHKSDISELIGKLKSKLEHTPAVALEKVKKMPKDEVVKAKKNIVKEDGGEMEEHEVEVKRHHGAVKHAKDVKHAKEVMHAKEIKHPKKAVAMQAEPVDDKKEAMRERRAKIRAMKKK